jgi:hypothetical protein
MKQTAVQWFFNQLEGIKDYENFYTRNYMEIDALFNEAKRMEIEQTKIYSIDKELFKRLPIEAVNYASCSVTHSQYFTTKMHLDKFKANYEAQETN